MELDLKFNNNQRETTLSSASGVSHRSGAFGPLRAPLRSRNSSWIKPEHRVVNDDVHFVVSSGDSGSSVLGLVPDDEIVDVGWRGWCNSGRPDQAANLVKSSPIELAWGIGADHGLEASSAAVGRTHPCSDSSFDGISPVEVVKSNGGRVDVGSPHDRDIRAI